MRKRAIWCLLPGLLAACTSTGNIPEATQSEVVPVVARVDCVRSGPKIHTPVVRARPDGVHFEVAAASGDDLRVSIGSRQRWEVSPEGTRLVVNVPPGSVQVVCHPKGMPDPDALPGAAIRVVDPQGFYGGRTLECAPTQLVSIFAGGSMGEAVEEAARRALRHPQQSHIVHTGYPAGDQVGALVVHEGRAVVVLSFHRAPDGGLVLEGTRSCAVGQDLLRH
jgi:hypothetical protein